MPRTHFFIFSVAVCCNPFPTSQTPLPINCMRSFQKAFAQHILARKKSRKLLAPLLAPLRARTRSVSLPHTVPFASPRVICLRSFTREIVELRLLLRNALPNASTAAARRKRSVNLQSATTKTERIRGLNRETAARRAARADRHRTIDGRSAGCWRVGGRWRHRNRKCRALNARFHGRRIGGVDGATRGRAQRTHRRAARRQGTGTSRSCSVAARGTASGRV